MGLRFFLFRALSLVARFHAVLRHTVFRHTVLRHSTLGDGVSPILVPCSDLRLWDVLSALCAFRFPWFPRFSVVMAYHAMPCHAASCLVGVLCTLPSSCAMRFPFCVTPLCCTLVLRRWALSPALTGVLLTFFPALCLLGTSASPHLLVCLLAMLRHAVLWHAVLRHSASGGFPTCSMSFFLNFSVSLLAMLRHAVLWHAVLRHSASGGFPPVSGSLLCPTPFRCCRSF